MAVEANVVVEMEDTELQIIVLRTPRPSNSGQALFVVLSFRYLAADS